MKFRREYQIAVVVFALMAVVFSVLLFLEIDNKNAVVQNTAYLAGIIFPVIFMVTLIFNLFSQQKDKRKKALEIVEEADNEIETEDKEDSFEEEVLIETFTAELAGKSNLEEYAESLLRTFAQKYSIVQGITFAFNKDTEKYDPVANYALYSNNEIRSFSEGEGISGQVAKNQELLNISNIPENYITVLSGLGSSSPKYLLVIPIVSEGKTLAVIELASFSEFPRNMQAIYEKINPEIAKEFNRLIEKR